LFPLIMKFCSLEKICLKGVVSCTTPPAPPSPGTDKCMMQTLDENYYSTYGLSNTAE